MKRIMAVLLSIAAILVLFSACGKQEITLQVSDSGETKEIPAFTGLTVEEALTAAQITLQEKDAVTPAREEKITKETAQIKIDRYAKVTLSVDGKTQTLELTGATVADALNAAKVTLGKNDALNLDKNTYLKDGDKIEIAKAVSIRITADGATKDYMTTEKTVAQALKALSIQTDEDDKVTPDQKDRITENMEIRIVRVEIKEETEEESIAYATKTEYSSSMDKGSSKTRQQGVSGKKAVTYLCRYEDGKLISKEKQSEKTLAEPVAKIVVYGTKTAQTKPAQTTTAQTTTAQAGGKTVVSKEQVDDCDGSGHGYYVITYSDGSVEYEDY